MRRHELHTIVGAFALTLLVLLLTSCGKRIEVRSSTSWSGHVNGASVAGTGNRTFDLDGPTGEPSCWVFQKDTEAGDLAITTKRGHGDEPSTREPYGVVTGCTQ